MTTHVCECGTPAAWMLRVVRNEETTRARATCDLHLIEDAHRIMSVASLDVPAGTSWGHVRLSYVGARKEGT